jgi:peptidyl serine alpha-galactosyltransferase
MLNDILTRRCPKKHVWMTLLGMIVALSVYDQILQSTLLVPDIDRYKNVVDIWYPPIPVPQKRNVDDNTQSTKQTSALKVEVSMTTTTTQKIMTDERSPMYYVVFSTSCSLQQHWESYVYFYHCMRVRQPGNITRIVSGCNDKETKELTNFHNTFIVTMADPTIQKFLLHFTPSYSGLRLSEGKYPYKYMNKPYGLRHWMENYLHLGWTDNNTTITTPYSTDNEQQSALLDAVVILMDPDMVMLQPITHDFSGDNVLWVKKPAITKVTHGNPISQQDGYLSNEWMYLNFTFITGDPTIKPPSSKDGPVHWNTGPPYLATVSDMYKIVSLWTETAPRVLDVFPELFAEMYGFVIATLMLKLPFQMTKSIVVSTTSASNREGWSFVDSIPDHDICQIPTKATSVNSLSLNQLPALPIGLHYCGVYLLGKVRKYVYVLTFEQFIIRVNKSNLPCPSSLSPNSFRVSSRCLVSIVLKRIY